MSLNVEHVPHWNTQAKGATRPRKAPRRGYSAVVVHDVGSGPFRRKRAAESPLEAVARLAATGVLRTESGLALGDHYYVGQDGQVVCSVDPKRYRMNHVSSSGRDLDARFLQRDVPAVGEWLRRMAWQPLPLSPAERWRSLYKPRLNDTTVGVGLVLGGRLPTDAMMWALHDLLLTHDLGLQDEGPVSLVTHSTLTPSRRTDRKGHLYDVTQEQWLQLHWFFGGEEEVVFA